MPWIVLCETERSRWGGDLRRRHVFAVLAERTAATSVQGWTRNALAGGLRRTVGFPYPLRPPWRPRPLVASSEFLTPGGVGLLRRHATGAALDVHDHPVIQAEALGHPHVPRAAAALADRVARNLEAFRVLVVPSASFADLARIDPARRLVAPNGTDTKRVTPRPFPERPAVGFVSGAAPGRGIELLVEAARGLRAELPDLRLFLWLAAGSPEGEAYVAELRAACGDAAWIEIGAAPYERLADELGRATVLVVPHPANAYFDVAVPVKLLDSMASGRPVVITPRTETRRIVEACEAGLVAGGDSADDLAEAIRILLLDGALAARLGANGRAAAERTYDWRVIASSVAEGVLERVPGGAGGAA